MDCPNAVDHAVRDFCCDPNELRQSGQGHRMMQEVLRNVFNAIYSCTPIVKNSGEVIKDIVNVLTVVKLDYSAVYL